MPDVFTVFLNKDDDDDTPPFLPPPSLLLLTSPTPTPLDKLKIRKA